MCYTGPVRGWSALREKRQQRGQALIYGLFLLVAGLVATFFLFNVGQLSQEKIKLVNATDAVAYSAGVMHARVLNFAAFTNQALVANEVAIAQMVSLSSWAKYLAQHRQSATTMGCDTAANDPVTDGMAKYQTLCQYLADPANAASLDAMVTAINTVVPQTMADTEAAKTVLKEAQLNMMASLLDARNSVMQEVAEANYVKDGAIEVDVVPLMDTFSQFGSKGLPMVRLYANAERTRMAEVVQTAVQADGYTAKRDWSDVGTNPAAACGSRFNSVVRTGATTLSNFDTWTATDSAVYNVWNGCAAPTPKVLGAATVSTAAWGDSGIPSFLDLSEDALAAPDPRIQFAVRVLRRASQTMTSGSRSEISNTPRLNPFFGTPAADPKGQPHDGVYVGLAASEVFFERPQARADGKKELASLFNPYWQVHLIPVPDDVRKAAYLLQGVGSP
jgi:Putative Flp pilus-assembly TadE/G-like